MEFGTLAIFEYVETAGLAHEDDTLATELLVFLFVTSKHNFKCPVAYFFGGAYRRGHFWKKESRPKT